MSFNIIIKELLTVILKEVRTFKVDNTYNIYRLKI
jgi:hypothetical protein